MRRVLGVLVMVVASAVGALALTALDGVAGENGRIEISTTRDLTVPAAWAGEWRITTTYRRGDTGEVTAVDDVTHVIRAREPVGLSALARGGLLSCHGSVTDGRLDVSCATRFSDGRCDLAGTFAMVIERPGETLVGSGEATGSATADCGALPPGRTRAIVEVLGFRLSRDPGDPAQVIAPLLTRFVASSPLLLMAASARQVRHKDNPTLPELINDRIPDASYEGMLANLDRMGTYFERIAEACGSGVELRRLRRGSLHCYVTRTDHAAIYSPCLFSEAQYPPVWKCGRSQPMYGVVKREFDALWEANAVEPAR